MNNLHISVNSSKPLHHVLLLNVFTHSSLLRCQWCHRARVPQAVWDY